jgi:uncharacterized protein (TIGR02145 family)
MDYAAASGSQSRCPPGWHIPSEAEWNILENTTGGNGRAAINLKIPGISGFNAQTPGISYSGHSWYFQNFATFFWTSDITDPIRTLAHGLNNPDQSVSEYPALTSNAFQARCLKD